MESKDDNFDFIINLKFKECLQDIEVLKNSLSTKLEEEKTIKTQMVKQQIHVVEHKLKIFREIKNPSIHIQELISYYEYELKNLFNPT